MSGLLGGNSAERNMLEHGYMERMGDNFYRVIHKVSNEHSVPLEELLQDNDNIFWHALTVAINEESEFKHGSMELEDLTEQELYYLIEKNFSELLEYCEAG